MTAQPAAFRGGWSRLQVSGSPATTNEVATDLINILDAIEVPIVVVQRDLTINAFNQAAVDALGLSLSDIGRTPRDISVLAGLPHLEQYCSDVILSGVESRIDFRDEEKWFVVRISPHMRGDDQVAGSVLTFTNVTAFRASSNQAIYERECTKAILNTVADPLVVLGADQRVQSGNRSFYTMFGVSPAETQGTPLYELGNRAFDSPLLRTQLQAAVATLSLEKLRKVLADSRAFEPVEMDHVVTTKGERTLIVDSRPLSFPGHPERRALVRFQDITARKQAEAAKDLRSEEELRRSEAFLAEGQRLSSTGSFSWKVMTDEFTWSEQLYRIFEFDQDIPVTLELIRTRVHPDDIPLLEDMIDEARGAGTDFEYEHRLQMPDRSIKYVRMVAHSTRDEDGRLEYTGAVQDVTARRLSEQALGKAQSELAHAARVTALSTLTASIAHEVNQPLSGIITNASTCLRMLAKDPPDVDGARATARRMIRDGNRATDVVARVRALFTKTESAIEAVDLSEVTREVIALSLSDLQKNGVALQSELAEDLPAINGDRIQLQQVILNLLRNASDAMSDVDDRPRQMVIRTERDEGDRVRLAVQDAGVGLEPDGVDKLFEPFYTTKRGGMGIGLSVSRSIIESHRGRLWAEPNDGPGATFAFSIPSDPESVTRHRDEALVMPKRSLVSVVDDDESVRESLPDLLRQFGFAAEAFSSAEAFLASEIVSETNCLLVDIAMPAMSGPDLQRELIRRQQKIPIVFITADGDPSVRPRLLARGAIACLVKPFSDAALLDAVGAALSAGDNDRSSPGEAVNESSAPARLQGAPVVFVVDDDVSVRESLRVLIRSSGWQPHTFASAEEFLKLERSDTRRPSCLVLDVKLPNLSGLDLQKRIVDRIDMPIIFITGYGDVPTSVRAMKSGAVEFLIKPFGDDMLLSAIGQAIERSRTALAREAELRAVRDCHASLTPREREIMALVVSGLLNKQIAAKLGISEDTVKAHRAHVMRKMQVDSVADLVRVAAALDAHA
jgi:FixJ family two-component response regulator/signal transduction histidine kinase